MTAAVPAPAAPAAGTAPSATHVFRVPRRIVTGRGCTEHVGPLAVEADVHAVLLVTDPNVRATGAADRVRRSLAASGISSLVYDGVTSEPVLEFVDAALAVLRDGRCDGIVAVGGGSAIDTGKAVAALATNGGSLVDYQGVDKFTKPSLPLIAVPTTAGTGSEVTRVTVVTDQQRDVKMMLMAEALLPFAAVDDPLLTVSAPPGPTAAAGVDALTHAIEAYVSRRAQPLTDVLALDAIAAIAGSLPAAWVNGQDLEARDRMMWAQLQAGLAFSNSSVALVHGMARPLGAHFHVPHGLANAMLLPAVMRFSVPGAPARYAAVARALGVASEPGEPDEALAARGAATIESFVRALQIPTLAGFGIAESDFRRVLERMAEDAIASGSPANNPRPATAEQICAVYEEAHAG
ncbi:MAG TPA: iron-containing alcohol dehydrogenase [Chloroflexota bacterium]|nr:iron-containing alcohol dehydrogenase [Chloroflexota bacterium]